MSEVPLTKAKVLFQLLNRDTERIVSMRLSEVAKLLPEAPLGRLPDKTYFASSEFSDFMSQSGWRYGDVNTELKIVFFEKVKDDWYENRLLVLHKSYQETAKKVDKTSNELEENNKELENQMLISKAKFEQQVRDVTRNLTAEFDGKLELEKVKLENDRNDMKSEIQGYQVDLDALKKNENSEGLKANKNRSFFYYMLAAVAVLSVILLSVFSYSVKKEFVDFPREPLAFFPWLFLLLILLSPFIWVARVLSHQVDKAEILERDYFSRHYIERRMLLYYGGDESELRKNILSDYSKSWVSNNPADRLMAIKSKNNDPSKMHPIEIAVDELRGLAKNMQKKKVGDEQ
mgnify:FL=1